MRVRKCAPLVVVNDAVSFTNARLVENRVNE